MVRNWQHASLRSSTRRPHQKDYWQNLGADLVKQLRDLENSSIVISGETCAHVTVLKDGKNLYVKKNGTYFVILKGEVVPV